MQSILESFGVTLRYFVGTWENFGDTQWSSVDTLGSLGGNMESFGGNLGSLRGYPEGDFESIQGLLCRYFMGHFGGGLGSLLEYSGNTLAVCFRLLWG